MSNVINKVKDAVTHHGNTSHGTEHHQTGTTHNPNAYDENTSNHGPHDSNIANTGDPRVDSDRSAYNTNSAGHSTAKRANAGATGTGSTGGGMHGGGLPGGDITSASHNVPTTSHSTAQPVSTGYSTAQPVSTGAGSTDGSMHGSGLPGGDTTGAGLTGASHNVYDSGRSSNYGPHDRNVINTVDPRVDSDRSAYNTNPTGHSTAKRANAGTTGTGSTGSGMHGSGLPGGDTTGSGLTGASHNVYDSGRSSNYGPHDSNVTNTVDPRVDSDRSAYNTNPTSHSTAKRANAGATGTGSTGGGMHGGGLPGGDITGAGLTGASHNVYDTSRSSNYGPHDRNVANTVDPRLDSDRSSHAAYNTPGQQGTTGGVSHHSYATGPASSTAGPHHSNLANKADPRVDSNLSKQKTHSSIGNANAMHTSGGSDNTTTKTFERAQETSGAAGSSYNQQGAVGGHQGTAGPHQSNIANKVDPRVDSDLGNSATIGNQRV